MDTHRDGSPESGRPEGDRPDDVRVAEIRREIASARLRIASAIDALEYKADVPSRLADVLSATATSVTARVLERLPSSGAAARRRREEDRQPADGLPHTDSVDDQAAAPVPAASPLPPELSQPE